MIQYLGRPLFVRDLGKLCGCPHQLETTSGCYMTYLLVSDHNDFIALPDILDPGETNDLAEAEPQKLKELVEFWHQYEAETGTVLKGPLDGAGREKMFGVKWDDWSL
jgi:hypothetical protein